MPFVPNSAKEERPSIKEKMELQYEKVLNNLLIKKENLTKTEQVKLFVILSNYLLTKTLNRMRTVVSRSY